jgi:hypothetical protein
MSRTGIGFGTACRTHSGGGTATSAASLPDDGPAFGGLDGVVSIIIELAFDLDCWSATGGSLPFAYANE